LKLYTKVNLPPSMSHSAFFYGTLMAPQVLKRVIDHPTTPSANSVLTTLPAVLPHHRRHRVRDADYPAIVPTSCTSISEDQTTVRGTFVSGLSDADIWRLDRFEGLEYERARVRVRVQGPTMATGRAGDGHQGGDEEEERDAETYVWIAGRHRLEDGEWDFGDFVREKMWRWASTDEEYTEVDDAVRERERERGSGADPTGGRAVNGVFAAVMNGGGAGKGEDEDEVVRSAV